MKTDLEPPNEPRPTVNAAPVEGISDRWVRITEIVATAWEMPAECRVAYLRESCREDDTIRLEVERLLQQLADSFGLLKSGLPSIPGLTPTEIEAGALLGRYRIEGKIGEGGMGVVFRALDTRLQRTVALKILRFPAADAQYRGQLLREAQMTAALSHPHIVTVYDTGAYGGIDFIAMEYMNGVALDQMIARSPLRLETAIRYAEQIASALAEAHSLGMVHRDLKPGNVMVGGDGNVKVLDFGIAKRLEYPLDPSHAAIANTEEGADIASNKTAQGAVFGTLAYMSPEQARGEAVDGRSDIFSFGAMTFELISGRKAFHGASQSEILDAVLHDQPPRLREVTRRVPRRLEELVSSCLQKDARERPRATEALAELKALQKSRRTRTWVITGVSLAAAALAIWTFRKPYNVAEVQWSSRPLTSDPGDEMGTSFSPDGKRIAYAWRREDEDVFNLYEQPTTGGAPERLTTSLLNDFNPAWSPDGHDIAFIRGRDGQPASIQLIEASGGVPRKVASMATTPWRGFQDLNWSPDNKWLAFADRGASNSASSIFAIAPRTGEIRKLAQSSVGANYLQPAFSPDGRMLAFTEDRDGVSRLRLVRLKPDMSTGGDPWIVRLSGFDTALCNSPMWRPNNRELLFFSNRNGAGGHLWIVDITDSEQNPRVPRIAGSLGDGVSLPAMSKAGDHLAFTKLYEDKNIWRVDLSAPQVGHLTKLIGSTRQENFPQYSPNGHRIAFESDRSGFPEIWVSDADGSHAFALTDFKGPVTGSPSWSPDSKEIAFDTRAAGQPQIFTIRAEPGAQPRRLTSGPGDNVLPCWAADGRFIYFSSNRTNNFRIWRIPVSGGQPELVINSFSFGPQVSPDGNFLYFMTGRAEDSEIHQLDLNSQRERRVAAAARDRCFSVTNRGVYYLQSVNAHAQVLRFWDYRTSQDSVITRIQGRFAGGLSASQDNRFVLFVKDDRGGTDLMLVEDFK